MLRPPGGPPPTPISRPRVRRSGSWNHWRSWGRAPPRKLERERELARLGLRFRVQGASRQGQGSAGAAQGFDCMVLVNMSIN